MRAWNVRSKLAGACALALAVAAAACIPADETLPTGSVQFLIVSEENDAFIPASEMRDGLWDLRIDRVRFSFKTMTIGSVLLADQCAYRGRGARNNVLFQAERGNTQTFNGILPGDCPDVGIVFGAPDALTELAEGITVEDAAELLESPAAHTILEATALPSARAPATTRSFRIRLRFDVARTTTTFGGCRDERRGVRVVPAERVEKTVAFSARALFRSAISQTAPLLFLPFAKADDDGNADQVVTMDELDLIPLASIRAQFGDLYRLPDGVPGGSFGDFVRAQLRFTFSFGTRGLCTGNPAGVGATERSP